MGLENLINSEVHTLTMMTDKEKQFYGDMLTCGEGFKYYLIRIQPNNFMLVPYTLLPSPNAEDLYFN